MANTKVPARLLDTSAIPALNVTGDLTVDTTTLKVDSTNNRVGIGTASPAKPLDVQSGTANSNIAHFTGSNSTRGMTIATYNADSFDDAGVDLYGLRELRFSTNVAEAMRITSDGDVEVRSGAALKVYRDTNAASAQLFMDAGEKLYIRNSYANKDLVFDRDGNLGIGTSSPSSYDSRSNNLVVGDSGDAGITIFSGATSNARLQFAPSGSTGLDNGLIDYDNNNDSMAFATGGSDRMRIDASGDITMSGTGSLKVPSGTTAQRPSSLTAGMMRYNSSNSELEVYTTMWTPIKTEAPLEFQQASTYHQRWTIAADGQSAQAGSNYSAISVNLNFEGNFIVITKWSHDYMGVGIGYKAGISNANFTGESDDAAGPYGGGSSVDGFDSTVSYMGQYHWPVSGGGGNTYMLFLKELLISFGMEGVPIL